MKKWIPCVLCMAVSALASSWHQSLPAALKEAAAARRPTLIAFEAPWCYSCYYMEHRVLSQPLFQNLAGGLSLVKLDVDSAEGHALKEKYGVVFLPTFIVADSRGRELGRILGEQKENDFLGKLRGILDGEKQKDEARIWRQKLARGDMKALDSLLGLKASCESAGDVLGAEERVAKLEASKRMDILRRERVLLEDLLRSRIFVPEDRVCADFRSGVVALLDVYKMQGDKAAGDSLLDRTLDFLADQGMTAGTDRNFDDNTRFFLELKGDLARTRSWYEALTAAYPADYVYPYRYAKYLEARGRSAEALPWIEKAALLSYGANRLQVSALHGRILRGLGETSGGAVSYRTRSACRGFARVSR